jgi:hypothetical protein
VTIILPASLPTTSGWQLVDYRDVTGEAVADAAGVARIELEQLPGDEMWLVDHAVAACSSATPTEMRLYAGVVADRLLLDGTSRGNFDVADWPGGLRVSPVTSVISRWTGATPGATATIRLQVRVLRKA